MRRWLILIALLAPACGGSSSAPTHVPVTPPVVTPTPAPVTASVIDVQPCPTALINSSLDVSFYRQIGCNAFDGPLQSVRRWTRPPMIYVRTVDEAGAAIDAVTLDTVAAAMINTASSLTGGKFGLAGMERGTESREHVSGWVTVTWLATPQTFCGLSDVAVDGGTIAFGYKTPNCSCNGSAIRPRTAKHELGHALGYWHSADSGDLMSNPATKPCDQSLSAREQQAVAYQYR